MYKSCKDAHNCKILDTIVRFFLLGNLIYKMVEPREESSEPDPLRKRNIFAIIAKTLYLSWLKTGKPPVHKLNAAEGVWSDVNLIRERSSKGTAYQSEYQPQVDNDIDDFPITFSWTLFLHQWHSTGQTDVYEHESRVGGLSQPANACTQFIGWLNFLVIPNLYQLLVCELGPCHCTKQTLASFLCSSLKGCHKYTCCRLICDCSEILTYLELWCEVFQRLTFDFSACLKILTTVYLSEHLLFYIGLHYGIISWCMIGTAVKKQYEKH